MEGGQTNAPDPSMLQPGSGTGSNPTTNALNLDMGALTLTQLVQQFSLLHPVLHLITTGHDESGDVVLLRTCEPIHGYEEVVSRLGLCNKRLSKYKRANLMTGPSSVCKVLQPDLGNIRDLFNPSQGIHLLQKGPHEQIIFEGLHVIPKDSTRFNHSLMTRLDKYFRFALAGVPQKYREATSLRPIFDDP